MPTIYLTNLNDSYANTRLSSTIYAREGHDTVYGNGGADILFGEEGNDTLYGGTGADILTGDHGNDLLVGGSGADKLYGGLGNDVFKFNSASDSSLAGGVDAIKDFEDGDKIDVEALGITSYSEFSVSSLSANELLVTHDTLDLRFQVTTSDPFDGGDFIFA